MATACSTWFRHWSREGHLWHCSESGTGWREAGAVSPEVQGLVGEVGGSGRRWGWGPPLGGASVEANAEALLKTLMCDPKGVFLIVRKLKTIILLKEL